MLAIRLEKAGILYTDLSTIHSSDLESVREAFKACVKPATQEGNQRKFVSTILGAGPLANQQQGIEKGVTLSLWFDNMTAKAHEIETSLRNSQRYQPSSSNSPYPATQQQYPQTPATQPRPTQYLHPVTTPYPQGVNGPYVNSPYNLQAMNANGYDGGEQRRKSPTPEDAFNTVITYGNPPATPAQQHTPPPGSPHSQPLPVYPGPTYS